jgi:hypothetical protein
MGFFHEVFLEQLAARNYNIDRSWSDSIGFQACSSRRFQETPERCMFHLWC